LTGVVVASNHLPAEKFLVEYTSERVAMNAEEFLQRYKDGERNFSGVDLQGAELGHAVFEDVDLSNSNLENANLRWTELGNVNLSGSNLRNIYLEGAQWYRLRIREVNMSGAQLDHTNIENCDLTASVFNSLYAFQSCMDECELAGSVFNDADLHEFSFRKSDLTNSDMSGAILEDLGWYQANFSNVNLSQCLVGAALDNVNLENANLRQSILSFYGEEFSGLNLKGSDWTGAIYYSRKGRFVNSEDVDFSSVIQISSKEELENLDLSAYNPRIVEEFLN
jgi:uncharacterized protein YjbI with pentapeptide repeats